MKPIEYNPTNYPSDLTDKEWSLIAGCFPTGNKSKYHKRALLNAVLYIVKSGCQWRMLPKDFPPYSSVWSFFRRARESGLWEKVMDALVKQTRQKANRSASPSYAIIDAQSVKTTSASEQRGFDNGKKS
jgi:putative transposase